MPIRYSVNETTFSPDKKLPFYSCKSFQFGNNLAHDHIGIQMFAIRCTANSVANHGIMQLCLMGWCNLCGAIDFLFVLYHLPFDHIPFHAKLVPSNSHSWLIIQVPIICPIFYLQKSFVAFETSVEILVRKRE